jgi:RNA polymerase sigma-70 factor (ECF subfamily)
VNKRLEIASIPKDVEGKRQRGGARTAADSAPSGAAPGASARDEDRDLVERARRGDGAAFRALFERHHRRVYALAYGMLHNADDALDVVQDAFIKAHRYLGKFEGASSFYTWLYRITMNLCIDHIRRDKRARQVDFDDAIAHDATDSPVGEESLVPRLLGSNPHKALARREIRDQIAQALDGLSENHRAVLLMRELEGRSYEEMADVMQCSKGTIMSRLFHARKNMQRRLLELMGGTKDLRA